MGALALKDSLCWVCSYSKLQSTLQGIAVGILSGTQCVHQPPKATCEATAAGPSGLAPRPAFPEGLPWFVAHLPLLLQVLLSRATASSLASGRA